MPRGSDLQPDLTRLAALVPAHMRNDGTVNYTTLATALGVHRTTAMRQYHAAIGAGTLDPSEEDQDEMDPFKIEGAPQIAWASGPKLRIVSRRDNTFVFGAIGDLHAASKYCRWDVRESEIRRAESRGAQCIFDTGNWIDGEARFNRHDLEATGIGGQTAWLAKNHPRTNLPIYAVTGDDHEGWYSQREGIDIGRYAEMVLREHGHDWHNLGYMESFVELVNANSGKSAIMSVVHPGGGSAYALSYRPQKIIESYEGGEKPGVALYGHYHKLDAGNVRNVWWVQTGTAQDQTPFMRKKSIEAHVGGVVVSLEQDPATGAIVGMDPSMRRYFNRSYYTNGRWSPYGPVNQPIRTIGGV